MRLAEAADTRDICKQVPPYQRTFSVGDHPKEKFSLSLVNALDNLRRCRVSVLAVVFDPRNIYWLCLKYALPADEEGTFLSHNDIVAESSDEVLELVTACHGDWVDVLFYDPVSDFWVYADHDEYTTVYSSNSNRLNGIVSRMVSDGHKEVVGWTREPLR